MRENYIRKSISELLSYVNENKDLVTFTWGLSTKTKEIIKRNILKLDFIIESDITLIGKKYNNIPIVSYDYIDNSNNLLLLWGNHCEEILLFLKNHKSDIKTILIEDEVSSILGINNEYLSLEHSMESKKFFFKKRVKHIEIEPHSYCNRTCWFCPNSYIDRKRNIKYMDSGVLEQLLIDLSLIDYDKIISFTRYSEPFGNEIFYETLKKVRMYLPHAILHANTNSDFLNNITLKKAYTNGLNNLLIQLYLDEKEEFNLKNIEKKVNKIKKNVSDIKITLLYNKPDWIEYKCEYENMNIRMYARDFKQNGVNRGDIKVQDKKYTRTSPCTVVFTDIYIDYNCNIVPCCNIRSDNEKQKDMIFGKLANNPNSIFEIYFSKKTIQWRKSLLNFDKKTYSPCDECSFKVIKKTEIIETHIKGTLDVYRTTSK